MKFIIKTSIAIALILPLLFAGCGEKEDSSEPTARVINGIEYGKYTVYTMGDVAKEKYDNVRVTASMADPKTFNPVTANETSSTSALLGVFESLTTTNGVTGAVEPLIAERWDVSEDGLTWTFYIRKGVKWSDGKNLTAEDVVFSFNDVVLNEEIPGVAMRDILKIEGKKPVVEQIDDFTVKITLPRKFAPFPEMVGGVEILPKHILKDIVARGEFASTWNVDADLSEIVGSGSYILAEYKSGEKLVKKANPHYWRRDADGNKLPKIAELTIFIVPNQDTMKSKFASGETDAYTMRGEDYAPMRKAAADGNYSIYDAGPTMSTLFMMFNLNVLGVPKHKQEWFRNKQFRLACAHAIDRDTIIKNIYLGLASKLNGPETEGNKVFYNPNVKKYEYDLELSKKILSDAGFKDTDGDGVLEYPAGVPVKFTLVTNSGNQEREKTCQIIQGDLRKIGLDVTFAPLQFNALVAKAQNTFDWDAMVMGLTGGGDPHWGKNVWSVEGRTHMWNQKPLRPTDKAGQLKWVGRVARWKKGVFEFEREIEQIFDEAVQELDITKRVQMYHRWQEITAEEIPMIYLTTSLYLPAVRNKFTPLKPTVIGGAFHNLDTELTVIQE